MGLSFTLCSQVLLSCFWKGFLHSTTVATVLLLLIPLTKQTLIKNRTSKPQLDIWIPSKLQSYGSPCFLPSPSISSSTLLHARSKVQQDPRPRLLLLLPIRVKFFWNPLIWKASYQAHLFKCNIDACTKRHENSVLLKGNKQVYIIFKINAFFLGIQLSSVHRQTETTKLAY